MRRASWEAWPAKSAPQVGFDAEVIHGAVGRTATADIGRTGAIVGAAALSPCLDLALPMH
ncbi:hypothetical protein [Streptomyces sp. bgisy060]|uniref:hypothetical protein n=1 Tax=Streptomyces sp. bgisy060 TaxID=3413775 RepID=UPI003EB84F51